MNKTYKFEKNKKMKVFKFGGASVKDTASVINIASILHKYDEPLIIVISAMGKTTNALERVVDAYMKGDKIKAKEELEQISNYHYSIASGLVSEKEDILFKELSEIFTGLYAKIDELPSGFYNMEYDQIVSWGEIISTLIISRYLNIKGLNNEWVDRRQYLKTDSTFREGRIDWHLTTSLIKGVFILTELNAM